MIARIVVRYCEMSYFLLADRNCLIDSTNAHQHCGNSRLANSGGASPRSVRKNELRGPRRTSAMSFLDRSHTIAKPGFSRWMVPPAALCIHLCIGQAYAFSVFNLPMTKLLGITQSAPARLEAHRSRLDLLDRHLLPRRFGRRDRPLGRGRRPAPRDVHRRLLLRRWLHRLGDRRLRRTSCGSSISATA